MNIWGRYNLYLASKDLSRIFALINDEELIPDVTGLIGDYNFEIMVDVLTENEYTILKAPAIKTKDVHIMIVNT
jgi:hypothetical protein